MFFVLTTRSCFLVCRCTRSIERANQVVLYRTRSVELGTSICVAMTQTSLICLVFATVRVVAALQTEQDGSTSHKTLRNGVVMPTIAAGTGGYDNDNQQGKVLRNGLVMPTMSAGTWQ